MRGGDVIRSLGSTIFLALFVLSCSGGSNPAITGPSAGSACETLGTPTCSILGGDSVVLLCKVTDGGDMKWTLSQVCPEACLEGMCVNAPPEDVGTVDGGGDVTPSELISKDGSVDTPNPDAADLPTGDVVVDEVCVPDCEDKECGLDGCGGFCGQCPAGQTCLGGAGICCKPNCFGKLCGDDGCQGLCGECPEDQYCNTYFQCAPKCTPKCDGKECGPDGCGETCGECPPGKACGPGGLCSVCVPQCEGKECGDNGCQGTCGGCSFGYECKNNQCSEICVPTCPNKECGTDGCSGSCGTCMPGETCVGFQCVIVCEPDCLGKDCGADGCGGTCGKCPPWAWCSPQGTCIADCVPDCEGKVCGGDDCGGSCGTCPTIKQCMPDGQCHAKGEACGDVGQDGWCDDNVLVTCDAGELHFSDCLTAGKNVVCEWLDATQAYGCIEKGDCIPDCTAKECGSDGCGGSCGKCMFGLTCEEGTCVGQGQCGNITYHGCCQGNVVYWCDNGYLWHMDCSSMLNPAQQSCGWKEEFSFYDCVSEPLEGPPNYPYYCQGACVPDCTNKQCGDDGCGGNCGTCPAGVECVDFQCKGQAGDCGGYGEDPVCQGETVVWCEEGQVFFQDCQVFGQFWHCGWVPDLFVYSCYQEVCIPECTNKQCGDDGCGYVCGYCPVTQFCNDESQCVYGQGLCPDDLDYIGVCDGNVVKWCQNGIMQTFDCDNLGPDWKCQWYDSGGYYWCVEQ